ncbi:hypothetical protein GQ457_18G010630 [Hibiscus cannabinus]
MVELQPNFFLIKPSSFGSMDMILKRRPWAVHNEFFSIKPYTPVFSTAEYDFLFMAFWIRVYKLPLCAMNRDMGLRLGGCVGTALGVDHRVDGGNMGEFLQILVQVDIRKSLRCVLLNNGLGKQASPCPLRYEWLSDFCYFCGLVGHVLSTCTAKPPTEYGKKLELQYGSWLRVATQQPRPRKQTRIEYFAATVPVSTEPTTGAETGSPEVDTTKTAEDTAAVAPPSKTVENTTAAATTSNIDEDTATAAPPSKTVENTAAAATPSKTVEDSLVSVEVVASKMLPPDPASPNGSVPELAKVDHGLTNVNVSVSPRVSKRTLQGKYEVCTPIQAKRTRLHSPAVSTSSSDNKDTGMSSLISSTVVVGQPRQAQ